MNSKVVGDGKSLLNHVTAVCKRFGYKPADCAAEFVDILTSWQL